MTSGYRTIEQQEKLYREWQDRQRAPMWGPVTEDDAEWGFAPGCSTAYTASGGPCKVVSGGYLLHDTRCPNRPGVREHWTTRLAKEAGHD